MVSISPYVCVIDQIVQLLREKLESNLQPYCCEVTVLITVLTLMTNQGSAQRKTKEGNRLDLEFVLAVVEKPAAVRRGVKNAGTNQQMLSGDSL